MPMHNPPHPGEFIREVYLEPNGITGRQISAKPSVSPSTLNRVLQVRIPRPSGHRFHDHPATHSTMIRPPIP